MFVRNIFDRLQIPQNTDQDFRYDIIFKLTP